MHRLQLPAFCDGNMHTIAAVFKINMVANANSRLYFFSVQNIFSRVGQGQVQSSPASAS